MNLLIALLILAGTAAGENVMKKGRDYILVSPASTKPATTGIIFSNTYHIQSIDNDRIVLAADDTTVAPWRTITVATKPGYTWPHQLTPGEMVQPIIREPNYIYPAAYHPDQPITWGELEAYLADTTDADSVLVYKSCYGETGSKCMPNCKHPVWTKTKRSKTLQGLLEWRGRK
jgi:hypothetical protein